VSLAGLSFVIRLSMWMRNGRRLLRAAHRVGKAPICERNTDNALTIALHLHDTICLIAGYASGQSDHCKVRARVVQMGCPHSAATVQPSSRA
jgi:hypothetical protein